VDTVFSALVNGSWLCGEIDIDMLRLFADRCACSRPVDIGTGEASVAR